MPPARYNEVIAVIERQIREGDYLLRELPGERRLAELTGVSYMTARRAVSELIGKGVLSREPNGKLQVHPEYLQLQQTQSVLLYPSYPSTYFAHCRMMAMNAAERYGVALRPVQYVHWHDPIVQDALDGADGVLAIGDTAMPPQVLERLRSTRTLMIDWDLSREGVPSLLFFPDEHIRTLLDHLWSLGHRRINCLNAQGQNPETQRRIDLWRTWLAERGGEGELWDDPVPSFQDPTPRAYQVASRMLARSDLRGTALVCTTQPAALGVMRACWEKSVRVGEDLSLCTVNNEPTGRYLCPSLTGLEIPDIVPQLEPVFRWFGSGTAKWRGPLLLEPETPTLLKGESTAAVPVEALSR